MPDSIEIKDNKVNQNDFNRIVSTFELDMIALFSQMQDELTKIINKAEREGWRTEQLMQAVEELI